MVRGLAGSVKPGELFCGGNARFGDLEADPKAERKPDFSPDLAAREDLRLRFPQAAPSEHSAQIEDAQRRKAQNSAAPRAG